MVSMAVLSLIVFLLVTVFGNLTRAWLTTEGTSERQRSRRALSDVIAAELHGALLPVDTVPDPAKGGNLQFVVNPPDTQVPAEYRNADAIFWQAPIATETTFGDIAEIGYFLKWDTENPLRPRGQLCRLFVNPSIYDSRLKTVAPNPNYLIYDRNPKAWLSPALLKRMTPADRKSGYLGLFAEDVVGFWVRCHGVDGTELKGFDSRVGYPHRYSYLDGAGRTVSKVEQRYLPARVTVSVAQLDSRTAERLAPALDELRDYTRDPGVRDADEFLTAIRETEDASSALKSLIPGLRIFSTTVYLENSR
jgi:hypothetical protein